MNQEYNFGGAYDVKLNSLPMYWMQWCACESNENKISVWDIFMTVVPTTCKVSCQFNVRMS